MNTPIKKSENAAIAARYGDVESYHATRGKSAKAGKASKSNQGKSRSMPSKNASRMDNSYKNNC